MFQTLHYFFKIFQWQLFECFHILKRYILFSVQQFAFICAISTIIKSVSTSSQSEDGLLMCSDLLCWATLLSFLGCT